jgi:hypothetical protein
VNAYHNDLKLKERVLLKMDAHRKADELVQGYGYWEDGKGCAIGCLIESDNHMAYESKFGIPAMLAYLEDRIFEGLPKEHAQLWPERFLSAINVGADLSKVGWLFLGEMLRGIQIPDCADPDVQASILASRNSVEQCAEVMDLYANEFATEEERSAAESAESAARAAAASAAWSAASAAWSAASAASAAESAESAARAAARAAAYVNMSDILIKLICEVSASHDGVAK